MPSKHIPALAVSGSSKNNVMSYAPPKIVDLPQRVFVGLHTQTSASKPTTPQMWGKFMPRKGEVPHRMGKEVYSIQVYPPNLSYENFDPSKEYTSWAAVEVSQLGELPEGFESLSIEAGTYAFFVHKGAVDTFPQLIRWIYAEWLPSSPYEIDDRIHFERLGAKFLGPSNPESEEDVFIPVKLKNITS